jgi:hypothetical protein
MTGVRQHYVCTDVVSQRKWKLDNEDYISGWIGELLRMSDRLETTSFSVYHSTILDVGREVKAESVGYFDTKPISPDTAVT